MNRHKNHVDLLLHVANRLGELKDDAVFIGGSICGLLLTDPASGDVRPTDDVDFVVQVTTKSQYDNLQERLRRKGFRDVVDEVGPICRMKIDSIFVDIIPEKNILGFHNEWHRRAIETSETHVIESGNISNSNQKIEVAIISGIDFEEEIISPTITVTEEGALNLLSELGITDYAAPWARKARRLFELENIDTTALARWNLLPPITVY